MKIQKQISIIDDPSNYAWLSMTEILPSIIADWKSAFSDEGWSVAIIQNSQSARAESLKKILASDAILFTCFNLEQLKFYKIIREQLGLSIPIGLYLHGLPSVGLWPLQKWSWLDHMKESDFFIVTSHADEIAVQQSVVKGKVFKIPFSLNRYKPPTSLRKTSKHHLVYVGRISEQKNLHSLFWAFSLIEREIKEKFKIVIYGAEDQLGSPNMGFESQAYLKFLIDLARTLEISDYIEFKGFIDREVLYSEELNYPYTFISCSLHSDENFGMAAATSLSMGHQAILTNWGGHQELKNYFKPEQITYINVKGAEQGPYISIKELKDALVNLSCRPPSKSDSSMALNSSIISAHIRKIIPSLLEKKEWKFTNLPLELSKRFEKYFDKKKIKLSKIFEGYNDPLAFRFFCAYGMKNELENFDKNEKFVIAPWANQDEMVFNDPIKGQFKYSKIEDLCTFGGIWNL